MINSGCARIGILLGSDPVLVRIGPADFAFVRAGIPFETTIDDEILAAVPTRIGDLEIALAVVNCRRGICYDVILQF